MTRLQTGSRPGNNRDSAHSTRWGVLIRTSIVFLGAVLAFVQIGLAQSVPATVTGRMPPVIVIGFVGGFIKHDNLVHSEVQLAARLRKAYPIGVDVETFESYHGKKAREKVLSLLDTNHDGTLTAEEKQHGRIIIYGHSWGGSDAISLARELEKDGIPVLLTIQVDSISKMHQDDAVIPANVAQAANFYQPDGFLHGQSEIRAADPARTRIIGNFRFDYKGSPYNCGEYPWYDRLFGKSHTQIECDPAVWKQAESLIRSNLPATSARRDEAR
jgi:pimeloyl-ACP methyl ester carboxylesterase